MAAQIRAASTRTGRLLREVLADPAGRDLALLLEEAVHRVSVELQVCLPEILVREAALAAGPIRTIPERMKVNPAEEVGGPAVGVPRQEARTALPPRTGPVTPNPVGAIAATVPGVLQGMARVVHPHPNLKKPIQYRMMKGVNIPTLLRPAIRLIIPMVAIVAPLVAAKVLPVVLPVVLPGKQVNILSDPVRLAGRQVLPNRLPPDQVDQDPIRVTVTVMRVVVEEKTNYNPMTKQVSTRLPRVAPSSLNTVPRLARQNRDTVPRLTVPPKRRPPLLEVVPPVRAPVVLLPAMIPLPREAAPVALRHPRAKRKGAVVRRVRAEAKQHPASLVVRKNREAPKVNPVGHRVALRGRGGRKLVQ